MDSGDSPAVARRRVRLAVREARQAKGFTQTDVAEAMEWSLSKVMRIESGEVTISPNDLKPLLNHLGIRDRSVVDGLVQAAKASKHRRAWWDEPRFRETLTPAMRQEIQYEVEASEVRHFCQSVIPGRLQSDGYARAILSSYEVQLDPDEIERRVESRIHRRSQLLSQAHPPQLYLVVDETVLHRHIGGTWVTGEQLADLGRYIDLGWLTLRIVPFTNPAPTLAPFELLYLGSDSAADAVLYRESDLADEIVDDVATVERHRAIWDRAWQISIPEEESARLLKERAAEFLSDEDHNTPD
jgi:transcriptional regulator with XRE-family HTH domain